MSAHDFVGISHYSLLFLPTLMESIGSMDDPCCRSYGLDSRPSQRVGRTQCSHQTRNARAQPDQKLQPSEISRGAKPTWAADKADEQSSAKDSYPYSHIVICTKYRGTFQPRLCTPCSLLPCSHAPCFIPRPPPPPTLHPWSLHAGGVLCAERWSRRPTSHAPLQPVIDGWTLARPPCASLRASPPC